MNAQLMSMLWLLFILCNASVVQMCSPAYGLVHISWDHRHEVQFQLDCYTWGYFCQDSGWGDEEATVICRQLGYSYGVSDYVPTTRFYGSIDRIECQGREKRLQDCVIQPASTGHSLCTSIGTVTACHDYLPQVFMSAQEVKISEDKSFQVCIHINGTLSTDITVSLKTVDGSALAGFDYISVGYELEFVTSGQPIQCVQIQLVDDRLAEAEEWFGTQLSADLYSVDVVDIQLLLWIEPSDGDVYCTEGSVTVVGDVYNNSLQLVEMCSSEGVWSPVCDNNWTLQDATVICRELGYRNLGNVLHVLGSMAIKGAPMIPECNGDEKQLFHCLQKSQDNMSCRPALVDCTAQNDVEEEEETREDETGSGSMLTSQSPADNEERNEGDGNSGSFCLSVVLGLASIILLLTLLVLMSGGIIMQLWCKGKRKGKLVPRMSSTTQRMSGTAQGTQQTTSDRSQCTLENSLYANYHTTPLDSPVGHIYSAVLDPAPLPPLNHNYATLEVSSSSPTPECASPYHVLEEGGSTIQRYAVTVLNDTTA